MLKKNKLHLYLLVIAIFFSILVIVILNNAGGGENPIRGFSGSVSYPDPRWQHGQTDRVILCDPVTKDSLKAVVIQGRPNHYWYNQLIPDEPGYYYVWGRGENCSSVYYYVYWPDTTASVTQNIVMDQPNMQQSIGK